VRRAGDRPADGAALAQALLHPTAPEVTTHGDSINSNQQPGPGQAASPEPLVR
jgi:hypothetical protein